MRKLLLPLLILCIYAMPEQVIAQDISRYDLVENAHVGTLANMSGSNQLIRRRRSNRASEVRPIGFDFIFMGKVYSSFSVNTNGVLRLGDEVVLPNANTYGIPGNDRIVPLAGWSIEERRWWWETIAADLGTSRAGKVHYKVLGSTPNRVLVIEWKDMEIPAGSGHEDITFQLRLHESTINSGENSGAIEMVYDQGSMSNDFRNFTFRTGFGIGPEQGNFVAVDHASHAVVEEQNYLSGPVSGTISYFRSNNDSDKLLYRFVATDKPEGTFSGFELACPAPNAATIRFTEDCPNEAGIAVYRKRAAQPDSRFEFVKSLPPDVRAFSDGNVSPGQSYVYRFYLLGESQYADTFSEFTTEPFLPGAAFQAVNSGDWSAAETWGGEIPGSSNDVVVGCAASVFLTADADAQVHNLTIQEGSFLTISDGVTLAVSGDFVNNGVFNPLGSGKLLLNGSSGQAITNNGKGVTDDQLFESTGGDASWEDNQTGMVAEKTINIGDSDFEAIKSVTVDITQGYLRDLTLTLFAPDGTPYILSRGRGGRGRNYSNVTFIATGVPLPSTTSNVNLRGEYRPEESFADYNGSFAGEWKLQVRDDFTGYGGTLNSFSLTLSKGGSNDLVMRDISINNSSTEGLLLNSGLIVQGHMELNQGIVHGSETETILFEAAASCTEGNASSYIFAPVLKKGTANFTFPIGSATKWAPLTIENLRYADAETTFRAAYMQATPAAVVQLGEGIAHISTLEYWDLTPVEGTATLDLILHWKNAAESQITDISSGDLIVGHYTNGSWVNEGGIIQRGSTLGEDGAGAVKALDISAFSPFTFASQDGVNPLPVELVSFIGSREEAGVRLQWETASELNNSHFEVQRSSNAKNWAIIGQVEGKGTTHESQNYTYLDAEKGRGAVYYRLKQVDFDGKFEYSPLVQLNQLEQQEVFKLYPNPAADRISIQGTAYPAEVVLMNAQGATVWKTKVQHAGEELQFPYIADGVYTLQLRHSNGVASRRLVIKK